MNNIMNMDRKAAARVWIDALRSGEYQQCDSKLRTSTGFCCMGVACDLVDRTLWTKTTFDDGGVTYEYRDGNHTVGVFPPKDVSVHLFGERWPELRLYVAHLNDGQKKTFAQIADVLEATLINDQPWHHQPGYERFAQQNGFAHGQIDQPQQGDAT